jgi:hypothetical protein
VQKEKEIMWGTAALVVELEAMRRSLKNTIGKLEVEVGMLPDQYGGLNGCLISEGNLPGYEDV